MQGTFDAGVKGLTSLSEQTIGNAPSLPIVLPNGQLSIVQGGLDGLAALQNDAHKVLEGAPKLPGVFDIATGAMGAVSYDFFTGVFLFSIRLLCRPHESELTRTSIRISLIRFDLYEPSSSDRWW